MLRTIYYAAAVIFAAALGWIGPTPAAAGAIRPGPAAVVYVDKAELFRLHPGWKALNDMKAVLSGGAVADSAPARPIESARQPRAVASGRSRSELAARAARDASAALDALEARKYRALQARCDTMRAQLLRDAETGWKAEARAIERAAAAEAKAIDRTYNSDLVNARLKVSAARAAAEIAEKNVGAADKEAAAQRLNDAEAQLARLEAASSAAKRRIVAEAHAKIDALRKDAQERVAQQVDAYEVGQRKLIAHDIAAARAEIASELGPSSTPVLFAVESNDEADLNAAISALEVRIDSDVTAMVLDLASSLGLRVVFDRPSRSTKDVTSSLAGLIKKRGWPAGSLASGGAGSS